MTDIPGDSSTTASVTVGDTITGTLDFVGDHDWFRIELTEGQTIEVNLIGHGGVPVTDPYLRIRDSNGNLIFENDDSGSGLNSRLAFTVPATGTYYIDVGAWNDQETGTYQLDIKFYEPPPVATVDEIADQLVFGYWDGDAHRFNVTEGGIITVNIQQLTAEGRSLAREALALWSDIIGVTFVEVTTSAQIMFDDDEEGAFSTSVWSGGIISSARINVSTQWLADYRGNGLDSYAFQTYVHEIGHALGLGHAGNYNTTASFPFDALFLNDGWSTSIMSYFDQVDNSFFAGQGFSIAFALTPMMADIAAMSLLYGLSTTTRTGDTTYGFNSNAGRDVFNANMYPAIAYTIFDSGGTDTLDYSGFGADQLIDLNPETFSSVGGLVGNVSIGRGVVIENAIGGSGNDTILGNSAANGLFGRAGDDVLYGGGGDDELNGGAGNDEMHGGTGNDSFIVGQAGDSVVELAAQGIDHVASSISYTLTANVENLTLSGANAIDGTGNGLANIITGNGAANSLLGLGGDDVLIGGDGNDFLDGGAGSDIYMIRSATEHGAAEFTDSGTSGTDEVRFNATGSAETLILFSGDTGIERIVIGTGTGAAAVTTGILGHNVDARALGNGVTMIGNSGANTLTGTAFADVLEGGNGEDRFYAGAGNDLLDGGRDRDVMYGGEGNDTYIVDHASDAPIELAGEGVDTVLASVAHTLKANVEHLTMTGIFSIHGRGNDLANIMTGNSGSNRMWGLEGDDTLIGNAGNDQLDGGAGNDTLIGGTGNDIYFVDSAGDTIVENFNEGRDTVRSEVDWTLGANLEWLELQGSSDIDGTGNALANVLRGNSGDNVLSGLGGNDKIYAGAGNDLVDGGAGNDWLEGGAGSDIYIGGTGSDRFVFREGDFGGATIATADVIQDFSQAQNDLIRLDLVDADTTQAGVQDFTFVGTDAFTGSAGELRYEQSDGNTIVTGDTDGDGIADFMILLNGLYTLESGDFLI